MPPTGSGSTACRCATTSARERRPRPVAEQPLPAQELHALWDELGADGPHVGIVLGGEPERETIEPAAAELTERAISYEVRTLAPHDPRGVAEYASTAALRGVRVIIATCTGGG